MSALPEHVSHSTTRTLPEHVSPQDELIQKIAEAIDENYDEDAYLPVYSKEGYIVTSGAARAVYEVMKEWMK